jgi:N-acetylglucosaminyldiphosphoundecaprenol N-acetyl-beta-D-mannosaminyltransferase
MGTPKQDFVSAAIVEHLGISSAGVGAAFDFVAGTVREAPLWVQRSGTEWIYRLVQEPQRLWKRYLIGNAQFVHYVVKHALLPERQAVEA